MRKWVSALAGAVFGMAAFTAQAADKAIIVLDASGSMWGQIGGKPKLDKPKPLTAAAAAAAASDAMADVAPAASKKRPRAAEESKEKPAAAAAASTPAAAAAAKPAAASPSTLPASALDAVHELKDMEIDESTQSQFGYPPSRSRCRAVEF